MRAPGTIRDTTADAQRHRVLSRSKAMVLVGFVLAIGALLVWASMAWIRSYGDGLAILEAMAPDEAAIKLAQDLKTFAIVTLIGLLALSAAVVWYGARALRSQSIPPIGSWIVEGQHVRTGREARTAAWVLIGFALLVALCSFALAAIVWSLAGTL